jgi:hypothetical protein
MSNDLNRDLDQMDDCDCGCRNELNLQKLCVKKFKVKCLCAKQVDTGDLCVSRELNAHDVKAHDLQINDLCANQITAKDMSTAHLCADSLDLSSSLCSPLLSSPSLCVGSAVADSLNANSVCASNANAASASFQNLLANDSCFPGVTRVADLRNCGKYRATASVMAPSPYTLGDNLIFNMINDDPNGNLGQVPYLQYTAPFSGYYDLSFKINQQNLQTSDPLLGAPVGVMLVFVNGNLWRELFAPYITFFNSQRNLLTSLISLNAGDLVTFQYKVAAVSGTGGFFEVAGTVDLLGNGTEADSSFVKISLLNFDCPVPPCDPSVACDRQLCTPCTPTQPNACRSCQPESPKECRPCAAPLEEGQSCERC